MSRTSKTDLLAFTSCISKPSRTGTRRPPSSRAKALKNTEGARRTEKQIGAHDLFASTANRRQVETHDHCLAAMAAEGPPSTPSDISPARLEWPACAGLAPLAAAQAFARKATAAVTLRAHKADWIQRLA
jgi:hypothetical protein